jgi:nucleoid-associated protein YgaU
MGWTLARVYDQELVRDVHGVRHVRGPSDLLAAGNVVGVEKIDEQLNALNLQPEAQYHEVQKGDTLSKISKQYYGDANKYNAILEANEPMLTHPDKIYPCQKLRIPPQAQRLWAG